MRDFQESARARLMALPDSFAICVGDEKISKKQAIEHMSKNDEIGKTLVAVERHYFDLAKASNLT